MYGIIIEQMNILMRFQFHYKIFLVYGSHKSFPFTRGVLIINLLARGKNFFWLFIGLTAKNYFDVA